MILLEKEIIDKLKSTFKKEIIEVNEDEHNRIYFHLKPESIKNIAEYFYEELGFIHPNFCMGTDLDDKIEVIWYIGSPDYGSIVALKIYADREKPEVDSLSYLWEGMNWHERETFEMLGVIFKNHGDLRRLILPEAWEGFPLRNDYIYNKPSYRKPEDELM